MMSLRSRVAAGALLIRSLAAVLSFAFVGASYSAAAEVESGKLVVSATVVKRATLTVLARPSTVLITQADLARGYVEGAGPMQVAIQNNSPAGYVLVLANAGGFVRQAQVKGLDSDVQVGSGGGVVPQRSQAWGVLRKTVELNFRFFLAGDARQGVHPWPMQLSVVPL